MLCTHKKTLETIVAAENEIIFQVKGNQMSLKKDCEKYEKLLKPLDIYQEEVVKAHGRIEQRTTKTYVFSPFDQEKWGEKLICMAVISRMRQRFDTKKKTYKTHTEIAYFISKAALTAKEFGIAIRNHWLVENKNHYVKDLTLKEDDSRIRASPQVFATLRSFTLNIFRANKVENIADELFCNGMDFDRIKKYKIF